MEISVETDERRITDIQEENMAVTLAIWVLLGAIGMGLMLYTASNKTIVIMDNADTHIDRIVEEGGVLTQNKLVFLKNTLAAPRTIYIPLERTVQAEDVVVENRYREKELWIYIKGAEASYYEENGISGDISPIVSGSSESQRGSVILKMQMNRVLEYYTTMENGQMTISFKEPHEAYKYLVVIDPMGGGEEMGSILRGYAEKTLTLQIANLISEKLQRSDIKLYFTRTKDESMTKEERIGLVEAVDADLYIRICAGSRDGDPSVYGISALYNEEYYIPELSNVDLADALTRSVTIASGNRALGLFAADEDSILQDITTTGAQINVGYLTHPTEGELLGQEEYRNKLAQGIADAITEVCADE
ncbi:MAG: N-acetylmuramoyl-L-alanine amidase [Lachnoclostridium sp.]|nr:N-acetylmuramoyl-L-alanine amidase [Lachnospira sp.]MCM1249387.1 N-acetylmuramoyl-L-alanine amidase [Lachnoclostridium sp.]MCM1536301.1 N-acetylmuramoyl-L-alanine amidase [Clostridium sp.]